MGKKVKKALNVATFGLSGAAEKLAIDPIKAALTMSGITPQQAAGSTASTAGPADAEAEAMPTAVSDQTLEAREALRKRQLAAAGMGGTMLTGPGGITAPATTAAKNLLGS